MTKNTVNEAERMVITRVFDAPRTLVWEAWTNPKYVMQWWGPKGFTAPFCEMDFRVGGKFLCCMRTPDGQGSWNAGNTTRLFCWASREATATDSTGVLVGARRIGLNARLKPRKLLILRFVKMAMMCPVLSAFY